MNDAQSGHEVRVYAARVRAARSYANLTQEQLAERIGVDKQTVKRWENASSRYVPDAGRRLAIAAVCHVPPEFLEHGFGEAHEHEIIERLRLIQATLSLSRESSLSSVREWVNAQVNGLREDEDDPAARAPTASPDPDPGRQQHQQPPARSRRRS